MASAREERLKLTATFMNSIASSGLVAAVITPSVSYISGVVALDTWAFWNLESFCALIVVVCLLVHIRARRLLTGMNEP